MINSFVGALFSKKQSLTGDIHYHTITAPSEKVLQLIRNELREKGYLIEE